MTAASAEVAAAYDDVADLYTSLFARALDDQPLDRAVIGAFAELVDGGTVADLGCGPGAITAHLAALGLDAFGIDLSPRMIELARRDHPGLRFARGDLTALDLPDGSVDGVLSWYSLIHLPVADVPRALAEFRRVLRPGGHLLAGFFAAGGEEPVDFDHKVATARRWPAERMAGLLADAGFAEVGRMEREPREGERFRHGRLLVQVKDGGGAGQETTDPAPAAPPSA
ncbi:class I SAM-dependent methyltransferase [Actinomadura parmotrematis]|uniref:Class I SAM-dependent methyltransferase n=1 Tax=Actinomadura parmotrematis TaxID=2864039 RepID=A0ABS7FQT9_9ACTN|nr:class I SAM-dependent methyltransferase [Actinomadura parmotrematis]MBW8482590.1 class I SAM-dependent methyltransferase [Actinomadura parmotrematis]